MLATNKDPMIEVQGVTIVHSPEPYTVEQFQECFEGFKRLNSISTSAATPQHTMLENIELACSNNYKWLHQLDEFKKIKGTNSKIALVGGGPSLKHHLEELKEFDVIVACGSVHDYLINNNIIPTYATICDPDKISADYLNNSVSDIKYLIATCCGKEIFDKLSDKDIYLWHCYSDENLKGIEQIHNKYASHVEFHAIGGGCTVGLRSLSIALVLGYNNIHFFGFDSCLEEDKHHAYELVNPELELVGLGSLFKVRPGFEAPEKKEYTVAGYQLAQVDHFKQFYLAYRQLFTPTFHGEGLLPDTYKMILEDLAKQEIYQ